MRKFIFFVLIIVSFTVPAIAFANQQDNSEDIYSPDYDMNNIVKDPFEKYNRRTYQLNMFIYKCFFKPIAKTYKTITPIWGQDRVSDFINNLSNPLKILNNVFQGDFKGAVQNFWRLVINCTFGIGGLLDMATSYGLPNEPASFDLTLAHYNGKAGPYIVIPIVGPATTRGAFGLIVDILLDPLNYAFNSCQLWNRYSIKTLDTTSDNIEVIDHINRTALDPYIMMRSLYLQNNQQKTNKPKNLSE